MSTVSSSTAVPPGTWAVDPAHSTVGFAGKHMGLATVRGIFTEFDGFIEIREDLSTARAYGTVSVDSLDTNQPRRDEHLRSPDFFDVAQYPELRLSRRLSRRSTSRPIGSPGGSPSAASPGRSSCTPSFIGRTSTRGAPSASGSRSPGSSRARSTG